LKTRPFFNPSRTRPASLLGSSGINDGEFIYLHSIGLTIKKSPGRASALLIDKTFRRIIHGAPVIASTPFIMVPSLKKDGLFHPIKILQNPILFLKEI
jgi:hypothetical protein